MADIITFPAVIQPAQIKTGMTLRIHQRIKEVDANGKEKERVQVFEGLVINIHGANVSKSMTVRKIASGVGVEKIFPLNLPSIEKIEVTKMVKTRRKHIGFVRDTKKRLKEVKQVKV